MTSTHPFPLSSPLRSTRRFARLVASAWRCYADFRIDVRLLGVAVLIAGSFAGTVRCNDDATAWVGLNDPRPSRRVAMLARVAGFAAVAFVAWLLVVYAALAVSLTFARLVVIGVPLVLFVGIASPFLTGPRRDRDAIHLDRRQRRTPDAVMIGDVGSYGTSKAAAMAAGIAVLRWADRNQRVLGCSAHDPEISAKYQRFGFALLGTKHSPVFGTTDVLVRQPRSHSRTGRSCQLQS